VRFSQLTADDWQLITPRDSTTTRARSCRSHGPRLRSTPRRLCLSVLEAGERSPSVRRAGAMSLNVHTESECRDAVQLTRRPAVLSRFRTNHTSSVRTSRDAERVGRRAEGSLTGRSMSPSCAHEPPKGRGVVPICNGERQVGRQSTAPRRLASAVATVACPKTARPFRPRRLRRAPDLGKLADSLIVEAGLRQLIAHRAALRSLRASRVSTSRPPLADRAVPANPGRAAGRRTRRSPR
jgi:hypothetical protein